MPEARVLIDPARHRAVIFDLDGVVTDTASVHAAAWRRLFDDYLAGRPERPGEDHSPFRDEDYRRYVDGKSRDDGVADFLAARGIVLPRGDPSGGEDAETAWALGNRKDRYFREQLERQGVQEFPTTVALARRLQERGVKTAVISASRNCRAVLEAAGLGDLFPVRVDGVVAAQLGLPGKPDPAVFLEAARRLGVEPGAAVVVEDARAGVEAARRGGFALVVGVDRTGDAAGLERHGADVVVGDLAELAVAVGAVAGAGDENGGEPGGEVGERRLSELPDALEAWAELARRLDGGRPVVFLDYDGTLSPIVDDPSAAELPSATGAVLERLVRHCPVAVVSGRDLGDVRLRVGVEGLWYAGSHGFELAGPGGEHHEHEAAKPALPALHSAEEELRRRLAGVSGAVVERKRFALAAHYRMVAGGREEEVIRAVEAAGARHPGLRVTGGRCVAELRPDVDWDKGRALRWLLGSIGLAPGAGPVVPVYAGDDLTDEDALRVVREQGGVGIVVRSDEHGDRRSAAHFAVDEPGDLRRLLERIAGHWEGGAREP